MALTYQMDVNELSIDVVNSIKAAFKDKFINITVSDAMDETEYLMASEANRVHLEQSIKQAEGGEVTRFTLDEFKEKIGK